MDWRGFELHPETPPGGVTVAELVGEDRVESMRATLDAFAERFGVQMGHPDHVPNTRRALALVEFARDRGALEPAWEAAMDAHWKDGLDLEHDDALREVARRAGLDPDAALAAADDPATLARVDALREEAQAAGVAGIPNFRIGDQRVVGCQPYEVLAEAVRKAGVKERGGAAGGLPDAGDPHR